MYIVITTTYTYYHNPKDTKLLIYDYCNTYQHHKKCESTFPHELLINYFEEYMSAHWAYIRLSPSLNLLTVFSRFG